MNDATTLGMIVDIAIVALVALNIFIGMKRGFIKTVFGICKFIVSVIAGIILATPVANILKNTAIYTDLIEKLKNALNAQLTNIAEGSIGDILANIPAEANAILSRFGRSVEEIRAEYSQLVSAQTADAATDSIMGYIVTPACDAIMTALSFIVIFIVVLIALTIVMHLLDLVAKLPVLSSFNKILGLAAGAIIGIMWVFVLVIGFEAVLPFITEINAELSMSVDTVAANSFIYKYISSVNPMELIISAIS